MRPERDNLDELRAALRADAAGVAVALLGEPNKAASTRRTFRWGGKGSLAVEVTGPNRGLWFTHEGGEGSDLLGLIQHAKSCRFPAALDWARRYTGVAPDNDDEPTRQQRQPPPLEPDRSAEDAEAAADRAVRIKIAQQIAAGAVPIAGTLGERYLKQVRGIPMPASGWPAAIRWHPGHRAIVAVATLADGTVQAVQRIHLSENGEKIGAEEMQARRLPAVKVTNGVTDGAAVRLPGAASGPLLIAEGPETGLSAFTATGHEVWVALGSAARMQPPIGRKVVVISDDNPAAHDAKRGQAARALRKALQAWRNGGVDLVVATPWRVRRRDRSDFADVILEHGPAAVQARIQEALEPTQATTHRLPVAQARKAVADAVGAFFDQVDALSQNKAEWDRQARQAMDGSASPFEQTSPPVRTFDEEADQREAALNAPFEEAAPTVFVHGVRCDVGTGKSHAAREEIARTLIAMRARDDDRAMVLAVPQHALSDEQAERFRELATVQQADLKVQVWRGRGAPDPDNPGEAMCGNLDAVHGAQAVGLSAQTACCKRRVVQPDGTKATVTCPFYAGCAYQAQAKRDADLWIVASDLLWHEKPAAFGEVAAVIVDEGAWRKGLVGAEGRHLALSLDALLEDTKFPLSAKGIGSAGSERRLQDLRRQLSEALRFTLDGPLTRNAIAGTLLTADSASEALKLEWARKVDTLHPGQSREERRAAIASAEGNKTIPRFALLWCALRELLSDGGPDASGWVSLETEQTKDGPVRVMHLKGRKNVTDGWKAPTLLLDALLPVDLTRFFWPDLQLAADVKAQMPHQHVRQVVDRAFAKSMLEPLDEEAAIHNPEEAQRRTNRLYDLRAILIREARRYAPGRVLVVLQKRIKEALSDLGSLPPNLELAHHNNVAGRDEWRDVAALIVVGRTQPSPGGIRRIAEALTGQAATGLADWYERADAAREMADGTTIQAEADRHPNPLAELIRWQCCEGELVQIIGRARGVNRTAADPVDVLVLTDVPLPVPLSGTLDTVELTPGPADQMMAAGGMVLENARHAATAFPFLWPSHAAAAKALDRARSRTSPYRDIHIGKCPTPRVDYQVAGPGQKAAVGWHDPDLCPDPQAFLRDRLGALAWCRIEGEGDETPPPDPPSNGPKPEPNRAPESEGGASPSDGMTDENNPPPARAEGRADAVSGDQEPVEPGNPEAGRPEPSPSTPLVCDVPWLHADAPAYLKPNGIVVLPRCPFCGEEHHHGGFGHRLAHCAEPMGRGYVLRQVGSERGGEWAQGP